MGKPKITKDMYKKAIQAPPLKAARTRFYDIIKTPNETKNATFRLKNKEDIVFTAPSDDVIVLGKVQTHKEVTPTELMEIIDGLKDYFHIMFIKADGTQRSMYATKSDKVKGTILHLHDLDLNMNESRACRIDRVFSIITKETQYVLKQAAYAALVSTHTK